MHTINQSIRLIATFKTITAANGSANYYDYSLLRYPEFNEILKFACDDGNINRSIPNLSAALIENLLQDRILLYNSANKLIQNPDFDIYLSAVMRFIDAPSAREMLRLSDHSVAIQWILDAVQGDIAHTNNLTDDESAILKEKGWLVISQPAAKAGFPLNSPDMQVVEESLNSAEKLVIHQRGKPIPKSALALLGRQVPELPDKSIIWGCDAGTKLPVAAIVADKMLTESTIELLLTKNAPTIKRRQQEWNTKLAKAKVEFKRNAYTEITGILPSANLQQIRQHVRNLVTKNYFGPLGDGQVALRKSIHNEPVAASLHYRLTKIVSAITREKLKPSYCYMGRYFAGAVLERHVDRPQCQFNMSVILDMCDEQGNDIPAWPIYLESKKKTHSVAMEIGSGLIYRGTDLEHWREALPANHIVTACFYHFVSEDFTGSMV
jgi:hypothetical protein